MKTHEQRIAWYRRLIGAEVLRVANAAGRPTDSLPYLRRLALWIRVEKKRRNVRA
jgi:hypothetical protein